MTLRRVHIVWNEAKNEGVAFLDESDAIQAKTGNLWNPCSSLADEFVEIYRDDRRYMQTVEIDDLSNMP